MWFFFFCRFSPPRNCFSLPVLFVAKTCCGWGFSKKASGEGSFFFPWDFSSFCLLFAALYWLFFFVPFSLFPRACVWVFLVLGPLPPSLLSPRVLQAFCFRCHLTFVSISHFFRRPRSAAPFRRRAPPPGTAVRSVTVFSLALSSVSGVFRPHRPHPRVLLAPVSRPARVFFWFQSSYTPPPSSFLPMTLPPHPPPLVFGVSSLFFSSPPFLPLCFFVFREESAYYFWFFE